MATPKPSLSLSLLLFLLSISITTILAQVPANETFRYVNEGEFGPYITEYDASYRTTPVFGAPFQLMWYNTTPGQFYVGVRMGLRRSESRFRWVWDANRGSPVGENATLTFGADGNLVLSEANGRVVWSTGTAGKGVVGLKLLSVGNLVLHDKAGKFVWQSFDHPTDTLLVGQSLRPLGATKLVSRRSAEENAEGIYSFVLEPKGLVLYIAGFGLPLPYYKYTDGRFSFSKPTSVTFAAVEVESATRLVLETNNVGTFILARPKYNATLSFLRLQLDGNLVAYTYNDRVDSQAWERTFDFFSADGEYDGCDLPSRCGSLGVCRDDNCVACPTPKGLLGWSASCRGPAGTCRAAPARGYYKVAGVESFVTRFGTGAGKLKVEECRRRCSSDCRCLGFFYWEESSQCWLAPLLGSLKSVSNSTHVAYIKTN